MAQVNYDGAPFEATSLEARHVGGRRDDSYYTTSPSCRHGAY